MRADKLVVRPVYGAGQWYPEQPAELTRMVEGYIAQAGEQPATGRVLAALAPHAGYLYSGGVAGYTYRALREAASRGDGPELVVVLGFGHRTGFRGTALLDGDTIKLPAGTIPIDGAAVAELSNATPLIHVDAVPHMGEHSAENQLPFIQAALPGIPVVVGLMGDHEPATINSLVMALRRLATTRRLLVIASTDLLHDADYTNVTQTDHATLGLITSLQDDVLADSWEPGHQICCGIGPVLAAMRFATTAGSHTGTLLHYCNSGDVIPESREQWVVGYGAVVFSAPSSTARTEELA
jgi:AmmeMemoRadiSam system protein B